MATKAKRTAAPRRPEKKYGPFPGGIQVVVWMNEFQTDNGPRFYRSLQLTPRRYLDKKTGEWKDAASLRASDLPSIILALEAAHGFMTTTPLPGQAVDEEHLDEAGAAANGETPF